MDPEGGKQPIVYEDAKYSVCANGEIYNFRQLQVRIEWPFHLAARPYMIFT